MTLFTFIADFIKLYNYYYKWSSLPFRIARILDSDWNFFYYYTSKQESNRNIMHDLEFEEIHRCIHLAFSERFSIKILNLNKGRFLPFIYSFQNFISNHFVTSLEINLLYDINWNQVPNIHYRQICKCNIFDLIILDTPLGLWNGLHKFAKKIKISWHRKYENMVPVPLRITINIYNL